AVDRRRGTQARPGIARVPRGVARVGCVATVSGGALRLARRRPTPRTTRATGRRRSGSAVRRGDRSAASSLAPPRRKFPVNRSNSLIRSPQRAKRHVVEPGSAASSAGITTDAAAAAVLGRVDRLAPALPFVEAYIQRDRRHL